METTAIKWSDYPEASEAETHGHFLKVHLFRPGEWRAAVDGEYVAPQFAFAKREHAKAASESAAAK